MMDDRVEEEGDFSDEEERGYLCDKEGYLHVLILKDKQKEKKEKEKEKEKKEEMSSVIANKGELYWCILIRSSLFYYSHPSKPQPKGVFQLQGGDIAYDSQKKQISNPFLARARNPSPVPATSPPATTTIPPPNSFTWSVKMEGEEVWFATEKEEDFNSWISLFNKAVSLPPSPRPDKDSSKGASFLHKTKKHISGKLITSSIMGKTAMRKFFPEEVSDIIQLLEFIVSKKVSPEKGRWVAKVITRTLVKGHFQVERKALDYDAVLLCYKPLREAFAQIVLLQENFRNWKKKSPAHLTHHLQKIEQLFKKEEEQITKLLANHLKPANLIALRNAFDCVGSGKFWSLVMDDDQLRDSDEMIDLCIAFNKLASFHVHKPRQRAFTTAV